VCGAGAHHEVEVAWVIEGRATYRVGRRTIDVDRGCALMLPAEAEHETRIEPGTRAGSLWLDRALVAGVSSAVGLRAVPEPTLLSDATRVVQLGQLIRAEAAGDDPGRLLAIEALSEALLVAVLRAAGAPGSATPVDPRIGAAVDRIASEYAEPLSIADLAGTAGMSRYHFSRQFRQQVGESPYRYLVRTRVERAAELLRASRTVTEAAFEVGFRDLGRFSRAFRSRFDVTPSAYAATTAARSARSA
jgi:AraC-like DNA-binding protein